MTAQAEAGHDLTGMFKDRIRAALAAGTAIDIRGSGSKSFYGRPAQGEALWVTGHRGIISYEPTELMITARCGTRLADIEAVLMQHGQILAFEPPHFGPDATLGGAIAAGLSGPRRPYAGAVRDVVLGVKMLNGCGEVVKFGGEVIKNVAGFDLARLMVGSLGTLGVLLDVSMKVLPRPVCETTLLFELPPDQALPQMQRWSRQNWPITALSYDGQMVSMRLSGSDGAIDQSRRILGGDVLLAADAVDYWLALREQKLSFFQSETALWRLSLAPATEQPRLSGTWLIEWGGALRWLKTDQEAMAIFTEMELLHGHACRFRSQLGGEFQPLPPVLDKLHRNVKKAFDPKGIFNPGRLYEGW